MKYESFIFIVIALLTLWLYWKFGSFENLLYMFKEDPENILYTLFLPLFIYSGYRSYVIHGNAFVSRPGKVCLACGKGMGFSDDGWGFKVYGNKKEEWYQFKACDTPYKCDIAYLYEVKWVEDEKQHA